nr:MAG TPA: Cro/C1-type HTH DNA-binding domain protein [Caudoviricetes sp.]DAJ64478.1 MAG TPA: Cro/C1-type HTH DNA-binding domain protein [Caudoviricetes sp.]
MFYDNFIRLCAKENISPSAAAEEMGFYRSVVTRWGKGGNVRKATLERVANYFGVTVADLIGNDSAQKEKPTAQGDGQDLSIKDVESWIDNGASEEQLKRFIAKASAKLVEK